jgi:proteasome lid subunit RPN8/RPN11
MFCAIRSDVLSGLVGLSQSASGQECCGLLAGQEGAITRIFAANNVASDPAKNYEIAPQELFRLMREIRAANLELLGIYHSHPNGKNEPSPRDIELAYYPDTAYFILSPLPPSPSLEASNPEAPSHEAPRSEASSHGAPREDAPRPVRAFSIREARVTELEIQII